MTLSTAWKARGVCRDLPDGDEDMFFPEPGDPSAPEQEMNAKAACRRCPVVTECLTWALANGEEYGIWGGLNEEERRELLGKATEVVA